MSLVMPNFKPTKWQIETCQDCTFKMLQSKEPWYKENGVPDINQSWSCTKEGHSIIKRDNIPFFVPDMKMISLGYKGWMRLKSEITGRAYDLGPTKLQEVIFDTIINKGLIPEQWWMYCKLGSSLSLRLIQ